MGFIRTTSCAGISNRPFSLFEVSKNSKRLLLFLIAISFSTTFSTRLSLRDGESGLIGKNLLSAYEKIFSFWKTEFVSHLSFTKPQRRRLRYFKNKMLKWLRIGSYCGHAQTMRTCKNILNFAGSLWHFFEVAGVEPTNNHAEQQLRPLVISKKLTFGTQSERGSRFVERIFTVTTTCKQQGRDTLAFIITSVQKFFMGSNGPSLILSQERP